MRRRAASWEWSLSTAFASLTGLGGPLSAAAQTPPSGVTGNVPLARTWPLLARAAASPASALARLVLAYDCWRSKAATYRIGGALFKTVRTARTARNDAIQIGAYAKTTRNIWRAFCRLSS